MQQRPRVAAQAALNEHLRRPLSNKIQLASPNISLANELVGRRTGSITEEDMQNTRTTSEAPHNLVGKLEELQTLLRQIGQVAAEGQELLASLAPQVEQSSTWMAELESLLVRWKSDARDGSRSVRRRLTSPPDL